MFRKARRNAYATASSPSLATESRERESSDPHMPTKPRGTWSPSTARRSEADGSDAGEGSEATAQRPLARPHPSQREPGASPIEQAEGLPLRSTVPTRCSASRVASSRDPQATGGTQHFGSADDRWRPADGMDGSLCAPPSGLRRLGSSACLSTSADVEKFWSCQPACNASPGRARVSVARRASSVRSLPEALDQQADNGSAEAGEDPADDVSSMSTDPTRFTDIPSISAGGSQLKQQLSADSNLQSSAEALGLSGDSAGRDGWQHQGRGAVLITGSRVHSDPGRHRDLSAAAADLSVPIAHSTGVASREDSRCPLDFVGCGLGQEPSEIITPPASERMRETGKAASLPSASGRSSPEGNAEGPQPMPPWCQRMCDDFRQLYAGPGGDSRPVPAAPPAYHKDAIFDSNNIQIGGRDSILQFFQLRRLLYKESSFTVRFCDLRAHKHHGGHTLVIQAQHGQGRSRREMHLRPVIIRLQLTPDNEICRHHEIDMDSVDCPRLHRLVASFAAGGFLWAASALASQLSSYHCDDHAPTDGHLPVR